MHRFRSLSRSGWVVVGLVVGAILIPGLAVAATATIVSIQGNGHTAYVTPANQLRAAETDPALDLHLGAQASGLGNQDCVDIGTPSATRAMVIKQVNIFALARGTQVDAGYLYTGSTCQGGTFIAGTLLPDGIVHSISLGTGVTVAPGEHLSFWGADADARADIFGYTVPASAAPHATASFEAPSGARLPPKVRAIAPR